MQMTAKTPSGTPQTPDSAELVARIKALHPLLRENAAKGEGDRRVVEESVRALTEAGIFKTCVPKRYGGYGTSMKTMLDVFSAVAEADGGTSWIVALINGCAWLASLFPVQAQDEVFGADPNAMVSGVLAPTAEARKVADGYRVSGRWYYNSGSLHATWAVLGIPLTNDAGEVVDQGLALVPMTDARVEDTWFVAGMKSSGSNCIVVEDAFVPSHRILSVPAAIEGNYGNERSKDEPFYRSSFVPVLALLLIGPQLGMGRAALKIVREKAAKKPISYTFFETQVSSVGFQLQIAEAAMLIDTAHLHAYRAAADIDEAAARGVYPDYLSRARVRADTGWVAEHITKAIDLLMYAHGAGGFADVNPLQRIWRDSAVAARHAVVLPAVGYEVYGKALLGVDERITPLV
jgi:alkylation response protein AidB-like acyl-CoA dehydrogenase